MPIKVRWQLLSLLFKQVSLDLNIILNIIKRPKMFKYILLIAGAVALTASALEGSTAQLAEGAEVPWQRSKDYCISSCDYYEKNDCMYECIQKKGQAKHHKCVKLCKMKRDICANKC